MSTTPTGMATGSDSRPNSIGDAPNLLDERLITATFHLVQRAGLVLVVQVVGAGLSYGLQVLLARLLGASHYGVYSYVLVWVSFVSLVAGLGFPAASVRFLPVYRIKEDWSRIQGYIQAASKLTFVTGIAIALCALGVTEVLHAFGGLQHPTVIVLGALLIPALAGSMLYSEVARAGGRVGVAFIPTLVARPILIGISVASLYALRGSVSTSVVLGTSLATGYIVLVVQYILTRRLFDTPKVKRQPVMELREWFRVGITLLAAGAFTVTLLQVDIVIVGAFRGSRDAGIYAAASKTASLVAFVIIAVNAAAAPQFASLWAMGRTEDLQRLVTKLAMVIFWPSLAIAVVIAAFSGPLLDLFGPEFEQARWALLALLAGQLVNAGAGSVGYLLNVTGYHREAARALGWSALACILLAAVGVWAFGLVGAALGSMVGFTLWNGSLYWLVVHKLGIYPSILTAFHLPHHRRRR